MLATEPLYETFVRYLAACRNEEELREMFSLRILPHLELPDGAITNIRHEYSVIAGRIDSLYGSAIVEFKAPGVLPAFESDPTFMTIKKKMGQYIRSISKKERLPEAQVIGIIFDGRRVAYEYVTGRTDIVYGPYAVTPALFKSLLDKLKYGLTVPKALTQANLIRDFGLPSTRCAPFIRLLYKLLKNSTCERTSVLYEQWKIYFREVCGYDFRPSKNLRRIATVNYSINKPDIAALTFSIHTYFSIVLTLFALRIGDTLSDNFDSVYWLSKISNESGAGLQTALNTVTDGTPFKEIGFSNLLEPTFFQWFIRETDEGLATHIRKAANIFAEYSTETLRLRDIGESDILKDLYQSLSPQPLRHALGEYYTPDWLAELVLERVGYKGATECLLLDPTCGSGTFLVKAINEYKSANAQMSDDHLAAAVLDHIRGIDLNPLAVAASKINYLIAMGEALLKSIAERDVEIPVYLSDAMLAPLEHKFETGDHYIIPTKVANFSLAKGLVQDSRFLPSMGVIENAIKNGWNYAELQANLAANFGWTEEESLSYFAKLYQTVAQLEDTNLDGVWVGIIKNFFAPSFLAKVDFVVGNPPWVNWENLPEAYRESIKKYWSSYAYNLFRHRGMAARLGSAHDDICVLLTYIVADVFLAPTGRLGFVLPQNLFKSTGGGEGFRSFEIKDNFMLCVLGVDDLNDVNAFGIGNKPSVFVAQKGSRTQYPVPYVNWTRPAGTKITPHHSLESVKQLCPVLKEIAAPIDSGDLTSPWMTGDPPLLEALREMVGPSGYRARKGVDTSLNAVFWVKKQASKGSLVQVRNCQTRSRSEVRPKTFWIEKKATFPLLRGSNFTRWKYSIGLYQVLLYDQESGKVLPSEIAARRMPKAWKYFTDGEYQRLLRARGIYTKHLKGQPVYSCFDIGAYSFAPAKVVWKALASGLEAAVVESHEAKTVVPDHNVLMVPMDDVSEAHYLCAVLNSDIATMFVNAYVEWFYSTHILDYFEVPKWAPTSPIHSRLASLSRSAHSAAAKDNTKNVGTIEGEINRLVRELPKFGKVP